MDKISVVIPAWNAADTIERAVVSAAEQTWENTEIIVVDDGSEDRTPEVLTALSGRFPQLKVIRRPNGGVSAARNTGIEAASGRWLVTLDDDDYMDPEMLSAMHACTERGCDLVICGMKLVYPDHTESFSPEKGPQGSVFPEKGPQEGTAAVREKESFLKEKMTELYDLHLLTTHSNKLYDMDVIRREKLAYDPALQINEDIDFVLRYLKHCTVIGNVPGAYLNYVQHGTGESLITTFRENGVSSAVRLTEPLNALLEEICTKNDRAEKRLKDGMNRRLLVHVLSFAGLMYYRSSLSDERKLAVIRGLTEDPEFRMLLKKTRPADMKTAAAVFLLKTGQCRLYHALCKKMYKEYR